MALITDPQAILFLNSQLRPWAEKYTGAYFDGLKLLDQYTALGLSAKIPNTTDTFADGAGSGSDGRPIVTGQQAQTLLAHVTNLKTLLETTSNLILNQCLQVAVTPR